MFERILFTDLDNTMIYSYKHDIGPHKRCVEIYQDREVSFITEETFRLLMKVKKKMQIVPVSTRSIAQYERIDLGIGNINYALVCNGGVLLTNGERDDLWYQESKSLIRESIPELQKANNLLEKDSRRYFELRFIEDLFLFTKCKEPERVVEELSASLDGTLVNVFHNNEKVYVLPVRLSKGESVERFRGRFPVKEAIVAGDSEFDRSMLEKADLALAPKGFTDGFHPGKKIMESDAGILFSEFVLNQCLS